MFSIPELLQDVMEYVYTFGSPNHRAIDQTGLVCKTWREAALTVKWREANLIPLLSLLVGARIEKCTYSGPLTKEHWGQFDDVARRVMILHTPYRYSTPASILAAIADSRPDQDIALFPRLQTLNMSWSSERDVIQIMEFLPENLERFDVGIDGGRYRKGLETDFMTLLPQRFEHLSELALYSRGDASDDFADAVATLLPQLPKLRLVWLSIIQLTSQMVKSLAGMPFLEKLHLDRPPTDSISELLLESWNTDSFPNLSTLDIPTRFNQATASVLHKISNTNFRSLSTLRLIRLTKKATPTVEMDVDRVLQKIQAHFALLHLTLQSMDLQSVSAGTLQPLISLNKLRTLKISFKATSMRIRDKDVEELLEHLPNLESLTLALQDDDECKLTLSSLLSALNLCPLLIYVGLLVDASTELIPSTVQPPHRSIRSLDFGDLLNSRRVSPLDSAVEVAAFIGQLSDEVLEIAWGDEDRYDIDEDGDCVNDDSGDYAAVEIWREVHDFIPIFQEARRRERLLCLNGAGGIKRRGYAPPSL
ncbi:hypothetical protein FRB95_001661 [Tulasnella sp. JGI-2019a]|nr:hypothetical protein FRB95_001661 [Tulasnella sp. JGI-2019a]